MSMRQSHMLRRSGVYWLRFRIPARVAERFPQAELKRSLSTRDPALAAQRLSSAMSWLRALCIWLPDMPTLAKADVAALVQGFFAKLVEEVGIPTAPPGEDLEIWADEQKSMLEEHIQDQEYALQTGETPGLVRTKLKYFLAAAGYQLNSFPDHQRTALEVGALRADLEQSRYYRFRLDHPVGPYSPFDQMFANQTKPGKSATELVGGPSVGEAIKEYLVEHETEWTTQTHKDTKRALGWFEEFTGPDMKLRALQKSDFVGFRSAILRLRKRATGGSFAARQTDDPAERISSRTGDKYLGFVTAFISWAEGEAGHIETNPAAGIAIKFKKHKSNAAKSATPQALEAFFKSPLFQGHHPTKVHAVGNRVARNGPYWFFVAQVMTGMRPGETAQLLCADVDAHGSVAVLHVRTTDELGSSNKFAKTTKNESSIRMVPIPALLLELGFLDFVARRESKAPRLFPEFDVPEDGKKSDRVSKLGARYLERVGQKETGKSTHWLRHAWTTAMRNGGAPDHVISHIDGHKLQGMAAVYGSGASLAACKEWIDKADFGFDLRAVLFKSAKIWTK